MSVADNLLFCEGKLDVNLLIKVIDGLSHVTIEPMGGKFSISRFVEGYYRQTKQEQRKYVVFRDRDFDRTPCETAQLLPVSDTGRIFSSYRTCVENYLLEADLIYKYWDERYKEKERNPQSKWVHKNAPDVQRIAQWIEESARELKPYQSVRWALGDLGQMPELKKNIHNTWLRDGLPENLSLESCRREAKQIVRDFSNATAKITIEKLQENIDRYEAPFSTEEFWSEKQYLIWFSGKDMQKQLQKRNPSFFSLKNFFENVLSNNSTVQFDYEKYPDLVELRRKIEQLLVR
jgi:hypothetical protein